MSARRGLTLIEVTLAIAILAIMGALTWGSIGRSFDAYETVTGIDHRYHNVRLAMNRMSHEISMAFLTLPTRDFGTEQIWKTVFKGKSASHGYRLDFTSFAHQVMREDAKESDQCELSYYVERDEEQREVYNLMRREDPRIDRKPDEGGRAYILADNVKELKLRFFDPKEDEWSTEWDTEKPEYVGRLPSIVEIVLVVEDEDKKDLTFYTKTRINIPIALQKF